MIRILDLQAARASVLHRISIDDTQAPPEALARLAEVTGLPIKTAVEGVAHIIAQVRANGDAALRWYAAMLDGHEIGPLEVESAEIEAAYRRLDPRLRQALHTSAERIQSFHARQYAQGGTWLADEGDSRLGQLVRPLERVGIYAPGGRALYPSSLLMAAIPARVAGVREVIIISPPSGDFGEVDTHKRVCVADVILAAAWVVRQSSRAAVGEGQGAPMRLRVFQVGGAQGIAALAYGTESIPKVDKILGPGGLFVVLAMRQVFGSVGIAGLPGPTETMLIADDSADPELVAADLLAQAEHDVLASAVLVTPSPALAQEVAAAVGRQLAELPRRAIITESLQRGSAIVLTADLAEAVAVANEYAPEHLCLLVRDPWALVPKVEHAGASLWGRVPVRRWGTILSARAISCRRVGRRGSQVR